MQLHIEVIDFDDVLVPSAIVPDYIAWFIPRLINEYGLASTQKDAEHIILSHFQRCGSAATGIAEAFNLPSTWVENIYSEVGTHLAPLVAQRCQLNQGLLDALHTHKQRGHPLVVATQSHRENYLNPLLEQFGMNELFPPHLRFGRVYKRLPQSYRAVTHKLEERFPGRAWHMSDDSAHNLPPALEAGARQTIWIAPDDAQPLPPGISLRHPTLEAYLRSQH